MKNAIIKSAATGIAIPLMMIGSLTLIVEYEFPVWTIAAAFLLPVVIASRMVGDMTKE